VAAISIAAFLAACQSGEGGSDGAPAPVTFAADTLAASVEPGSMLAIPVQGSSQEIARGFSIRFSFNGQSVDSPPLRVEAGQAFVMVPPMAETVSIGVTVAIADMDGVVTDTHPQTIDIGACTSSPLFTTASFDAAVGGGLARLVSLAIETFDTLEQEAVMDAAAAGPARDALGYQVDILNQISYFTENLGAEQLALLQQLLYNSGYLSFLADAAGVSLQGTGSQGSALKSVWHAMIESALLKADFASLLIGEVRGALTLLAYVMNQVSSWPIIGQWAQGVAAWATGLSAQLKTPHDIINSVIPTDLVQMSGPSLAMITLGQSADVIAYGRFETESAFDQQLLTQLIQTYVVNNVNKILAMVGQYLPTGATGYLQQLSQQIPGWIINWLTNSGYIGTTVMPGSSYTVLTIPNFELDMAQYRFDVAGIVANLLNLPYSAINAFFNWIGVGVGSPVGGYEGVKTSNGAIVGYTPASDSLSGLAKGSVTATYIAPMCRPAGGWWAQWGFYGIQTTNRNVIVTVQ